MDCSKIYKIGLKAILKKKNGETKNKYEINDTWSHNDKKNIIDSKTTEKQNLDKSFYNENSFYKTQSKVKKNEFIDVSKENLFNQFELNFYFLQTEKNLKKKPKIKRNSEDVGIKKDKNKDKNTLPKSLLKKRKLCPENIKNTKKDRLINELKSVNLKSSNSGYLYQTPKFLEKKKEKYPPLLKSISKLKSNFNDILQIN